MSRVTVVFFDAAGTLFHVKGSVAEVYLAYAEPYGVRRTPELLEAVSAAFRRAFRDSPPPIFAATEPADIKRCERLWWFDIVHTVFYRVGMFEGFDEYFDTVFRAFADPQQWVLCPDTLGALTALKEGGYELGIISNFDTRLFPLLRGLGIEGLFDTVTISTLAKAVKPASQIFRLALDKHAVDPEDALHVGDSVRDDVEGARQAGLIGVLIDRGQAHDRIVPDATPRINTLDELPRLLATL
ncbi:MAG: HAD-IA family hydrolase [Nitrospira sp.]|nr:HAD-IA family hydrolase [Nitrospira sp.]